MVGGDPSTLWRAFRTKKWLAVAVGMLVENTGSWNPALHQPVEPSERNAAALAAA